MFENTKKQSVLLLISSLVFFAAILAFVLFTDPYSLTPPFFFLFYLALAGFLMSFFTFVLYSWRGRKPDRLFSDIRILSVRQAFLLTILAVALLVLSAHQILFWWTGLLLITTVILIEGFFLVK